jgi:hypothetical protein
MFSSILKKKLSEDQVSNIFINGIFDVIDRGFELVAGAINEDPCFISSPSIDTKNVNEFALIVITGNIIEMERLFDGQSGTRVINLVYDKLASVYKMEELEMRQLIQDYKSYMKRVNIPSKTTLYAMSKAVFHKYGLTVPMELGGVLQKVSNLRPYYSPGVSCINRFNHRATRMITTPVIKA